MQVHNAFIKTALTPVNVMLILAFVGRKTLASALILTEVMAVVLNDHRTDSHKPLLPMCYHVVHPSEILLAVHSLVD